MTLRSPIANECQRQIRNELVAMYNRFGERYNELSNRRMDKSTVQGFIDLDAQIMRELSSLIDSLGQR